MDIVMIIWQQVLLQHEHFERQQEQQAKPSLRQRWQSYRSDGDKWMQQAAVTNIEVDRDGSTKQAAVANIEVDGDGSTKQAAFANIEVDSNEVTHKK